MTEAVPCSPSPLQGQYDNTFQRDDQKIRGWRNVKVQATKWSSS